jgi:hypothetical protein
MRARLPVSAGHSAAKPAAKPVPLNRSFRAESGMAGQSGRAKSSLSRTLKTMERYGLVHFEEGPNRQRAPRVNYSGVELEMSFQN